jgi:hypothetical protein
MVVLHALLLLAVSAVAFPTDYLGGLGGVFILPFSTLLLAWGFAGVAMDEARETG